MQIGIRFAPVACVAHPIALVERFATVGFSQASITEFISTP